MRLVDGGTEGRGQEEEGVQAVHQDFKAIGEVPFHLVDTRGFVNSDILVVVDISLSLLACLYVTCVCWWLLLLLVLLLALKNKQVYGSSPWYILLVVLVILITTLVVATGH